MALNLFELSLLQKMHEALQCTLLDRVSVIVTYTGNAGAAFILLALALLCFKRTRILGAIMATSLALDGVLVNICLKPMLARVRPYDLGVELYLIASRPKDYAFPSGHTAVAFAAATAMSKGPRKVYIAMLAYALLMSFSRLYLMMHYPTDVLGGAVCGALCGFLSVRIWKRLTTTKGAEP